MYLLINNDGILIKEGLPNLQTMQTLVGNPHEKAWIEFVYEQFDDYNIVLICDDSGLLKRLKPTCITPKRLMLHGQILAVKYKHGNLASLTNRQLNIVVNGLTIINSVEKYVELTKDKPEIAHRSRGAENNYAQSN